MSNAPGGFWTNDMSDSGTRRSASSNTWPCAVGRVTRAGRFSASSGVGKTSLAAAVARALGRGFAEMPCNSLKEVADVRGARRDYAGAHPGAIIRQLQKAGARNPVFLLDEIDKVGWAPGMALLDALDPTRNAEFHDLYVDVPFDLSEVFFIATANVLDQIPAELRDRVEAIEIAGYKVEEKFEIAKRILVPTRIRDHGLTGGLIAFEDEALRAMIRRPRERNGRARPRPRRLGDLPAEGAPTGDVERRRHGNGHGDGERCPGDARAPPRAAASPPRGSTEARLVVSREVRARFGE